MAVQIFHIFLTSILLHIVVSFFHKFTWQLLAYFLTIHFTIRFTKCYRPIFPSCLQSNIFTQEGKCMAQSSTFKFFNSEKDVIIAYDMLPKIISIALFETTPSELSVDSSTYIQHSQMRTEYGRALNSVHEHY